MELRTLASARFRIVRALGSGATGDVYEAIERDRGARVAVKALRTTHPIAVARFKSEFRALADLEHPNLVSLGELVEEDGRLFFTMELVRGADFLTHVRPGALDEARLRHALLGLGRGLDALHQAGKVHRDVKPSNVLVTSEGRVVILDFGLTIDAEHADSWTGPSIVGTPNYMAPEQAAGQPAGAAADWYAVGVMLYEALTGRPPHDGPVMKVLQDKQQVAPPPPEELAPDAPADLAALCAALLRFDPADRPSGPSVLRRLGRGATAPPLSPTSTQSDAPPFIGRDRELRQLGEALAGVATHRGAPCAVLIRGESGVGKTTLARVFTGALDGATVVLTGRCFERESVSYKVFDGVTEALARALAGFDPVEAAALLPLHAALLATVFPALRRIRAFADAPAVIGVDELDQRELRARVFHAMRELLVRLAARRIVVLAIDDLQWADDDSLAMLDELLVPPDAPPMLVLATVRPEARPTRDHEPDVAARLHAACADTRTIELGPLDAAAARELAARLAEVHGVGGTIDVDAVAQEAGGHPLFLDELVRHAATGGASGGRVRLDDALWARVVALEPRARDLLEHLALAGQPMPQETIARAADVAADQLGRLISVLRVANLARTRGTRAWDTVEPYHDRVRQAVIARLAPTQRQAIHRALAIAIEGTPHHAQESMLAYHWEAAGRHDLAARHAALAAQRAADGLAFDLAVRFYRMALALGHPDRAALLGRLGDALGVDGRGAEAADAYLEAAGLTPADAVALDLRRLAAEQLLISGHIDRGLELITTLLDALGMSLPRTPRTALASLVLRRALLRARGLRFRERQEDAVAATELTRVDLCWSVATGLAMVDNIRGADFQTRHLLLALRAGEPTRVARALAIEGGFLCCNGPSGRRRARTLFDTAQAMLARAPSPNATALLLGAEAIAAYQGGRWRRALALAHRAELAIRSHRGRAWEVDTIYFFWLYALFYVGDLRELSVLAPALLRDATARGDLYGATNLRVGLCNSAWLVAGDLATARAHLDEAARQWTARGFHVQHYHHMLGLGNLRLYAGEAVAGHAELLARWPALEASMLLRVQLVRLEVLHLRARLALAAARERPAERDRYLSEVARVATTVARSREPWAVPLAELLRAGLSAARGATDDAAARLRRAADGLDAADMAMWAAVARLRLGRILGGADGDALVEATMERFRIETVAEPAAFATMLVPGFAD